MKYKVGDKVKIKTWDQMKNEFGVNSINNITCRHGYQTNMEDDIQKMDTNRVLIIEDEGDNCYYMKDIGWVWTDDMIEGLTVNTDYHTIDNRFELMDFD